jgi:predicted phage-related endonuclease
VTETGKVPPHHMPQLQHQLFVAGKDLGYYYSFDGSEGLTIEVKRNPEFIISMMEKEIEFWKCLEWMIPPM